MLGPEAVSLEGKVVERGARTEFDRHADAEPGLAGDAFLGVGLAEKMRVGRRILDECEAAARREGFSELVLNATLSGVPLYEAFGFEPTEDIVVTMPDGVPMEAVSMRKTIGAGPTD